MKFDAPLRDYQSEAVAKARPYGGFALFMEPRTGKTRTALAIIAERPVDFLLIVCPKGVKDNRVWEREIELCFPEGLGVETEIVNFERVWKERVRLKKKMEKSAHGAIIIDESHRIKKRGNQQSRAARVISVKKSSKAGIVFRAQTRLVLSGTPIAQGIEDAWSQFDLIDSNIFGTWERFADRYLVYGGFEKREIISYQNQDEFNRIFHQYSYRRTLSEVRKKSPLVKRVRVPVKLPASVRAIYTRLEKELTTEVLSRRVSAPNVISQAVKLQQLCGGFIKLDDGGITPVHREKLRALRSLLLELGTEPVVICARYLWEIDRIAEIVRSQFKTLTVVKGGQPLTKPFSSGVAIVQIQSGVGIDLSASHKTIFYSWDYSYINHDQFRARIASFTSDYLIYYYLIMEETVDEVIYETVRRKQKFSKAICDHYRNK